MIWVFVLKPAKVVNYRHNPTSGRATVFLTAQSTTHHLHISNRAEYLSRDENHVRFGRVETGRQDTVVAEHANIPALESCEEKSAALRWA